MMGLRIWHFRSSPTRTSNLPFGAASTWQPLRVGAEFLGLEEDRALTFRLSREERKLGLRVTLSTISPAKLSSAHLEITLRGEPVTGRFMVNGVTLRRAPS